MGANKNGKEFYAKLKGRLEKNSQWPSIYLYKFIVPSTEQRIAQIAEIFDGMNADIQTKSSGKGNYTSVSIHVKMPSPDAVISKYKEVGEKVADVISL